MSELRTLLASARAGEFDAGSEQAYQPFPIALDVIPPPLGDMLVGATQTGLCLLEFGDRLTLRSELFDLARLLQTRFVEDDSMVINQTREAMKVYFEGSTQHFDIPLVTPGTPFQQKVWRALRGIPFGETRSYKDQSKALGSTAAIRAVARANGMNRIAIVIPCHRVIGESGALTGYAGGLWRKRWLIDHESRVAGTTLF